MTSDGDARFFTDSALRSMRDLLTRPAVQGLILQEACPIADSIPWLCSQEYWARAGVEVFVSGEVPYVVTNDGEQSRKALELYLASLRAAERDGTRESQSYVLELGTGSGLFAKLFLDQLKARDRAGNSGDYERTTYIVGDLSPSLLRDTELSGVFADHEARVQRVLLPAGGLRDALSRALPEAVGSLRAAHANYVLDSLPFTILSSCERGLFELRIRTRLRELLELTPPENATLSDLVRWLSEFDDAPHSALQYESEYAAINRAQLKYPELVERCGQAGQQVHSYGAVECLDEVLGLLRSDGHFIAMDYGCDGASQEPIEFQCFGTSVAAGVNFAQLVEHTNALSNARAVVPDSDPSALQARMFARKDVSELVVAGFRALYDKAAWDRTETPYLEALKLAQTGRFEAARWKFDEAHDLQPYNWSLHEAIAGFLTYTLAEHASALEVAKRALQLNHLSPRAWNLLGDAYYGLGALDEAERAYQHVLRVHPSDVRARANLAYVFLKRRAPSDALRMLGDALALDRAGDLRDELLAKQSEALQMMAERHVRSAFGDINRLTGHHALPNR